MRVAVCMHGLSSGINHKNENNADVIDCLKSFKENLGPAIEIKFDYFFHSWSHENAHAIFDEIEPKNYIFENHKTFHKNNLFDWLKHQRRKIFFDMNQPLRKNNIISRWYSLEKSVQVMTEYSNERKVDYDFVLITRFDAFLLSKYNFKKLDPSKFYASHWLRYFNNNKEIDERLIKTKNEFRNEIKGYPKDNEGIHDFIFICNQENAKKFSDCHKEINNHFNEVGLSSHKIALNQLKKINLLNKLEFYNYFSEDISLGRWVAKNDS